MSTDETTSEAGAEEGGRSPISRLRHDLRNDLTVVLGYAHLLAAMPGLPEQATQRARAIAQYADRMVERLRESRAED